MAKTFPPDLLHPCPYNGLFNAFNVTPDISSEMATFMTGYYRMKIRVFDDIDENIVTFLTDTELL
jgi:hypothetical protein